MKLITFLSLYFFALFANAANKLPPTISFNYDRVSVVQFIEVTYKSLLGQQYVIDPQLVDDSSKITMQVKDLQTEKLPSFLESMLLSAGITVQMKDGITYFIPSSKLASSKQNQTIPTTLNSNNLPPSLPISIDHKTVFEQVNEQPEMINKTEIYSPKYRSVNQLQDIANNLMGTQFKDTESVFLVGTQKKIESVKKLLEQYDAVPGEVLVRARVYEFTDTFSDGFNAGGAITSLLSKLNVSGGSLAAMQNLASIKSATLQSVVSAVSGDSRFNLVSSPTIRVKHGESARLTIGSETPVLSSIQSDKNGNPIQSIIYRQSGVILDLKPMIMMNRIELDVNQEVSSFTKTNTSGIDSPTLLKRSLHSVIGVDSGDLVMLGGFDEDKGGDSKSGLSFLPDFFKTKSLDKSKTQILLVMEVKKL